MNANLFLFFISILIFTSCGEKVNKVESKKTKPEMQMELGILPELISLPATPIKVKWLPPDPTIREKDIITAVLQFKEEDYRSIVKNSPDFDLIVDDSLPKDIFERWIDKSIAKNIEIEEKSRPYGDVYILKGVRGKKPDLFIKKPSSPYIHGSITPLGSGYIFIGLSTM